MITTISSMGKAVTSQIAVTLELRVDKNHDSFNLLLKLNVRSDFPRGISLQNLVTKFYFFKMLLSQRRTVVQHTQRSFPIILDRLAIVIPPFVVRSLAPFEMTKWPIDS